MTLDVTADHLQAMRAVDNGRIAWSALPNRERFLRRDHVGGVWVAFPTTGPALGQLIALCAVLADGLIEVVDPPPDTDHVRPRTVRVTARGRAMLPARKSTTRPGDES